MGIREGVENFTNFLNNDLREEYHQERIFNVGDMIEHMDGTKGMIVRRGSNYVSFESDGLIKKAWLYDIQMSEEPRIPRKKGQPAGSDKHSDLYTDENPKGTVKGLGFKDVATAKASVSKIKNSGKAHAHKIQAAIAMEQRARVMGKTAEAAVYRTFINAMKNGSLPSMHGGDRDENWAIREDALRYLHSLALEMCMERDMPMQFHAGDGEPPRGILRNQDPFDMEEMIRFDKDGLIRTPKIILIHAGYPNIGKAAWISHLYTNCYFEISLATPLIHQGMLRMYLEAMEVVPLTKILFGSDAYHLPEFYWLAAKWGRIFLSQALGVYVDAKILTEDEAITAAKQILFQNNRRVYNI